MSSPALRLVLTSRTLFGATCFRTSHRSVACLVRSLSQRPVKETCREEKKLNLHLNSHVRGFCAAGVELKCWNCLQTLDKPPAFFCLSCKSVQPADEDSDFFKIMDCERTFSLNTQTLQKVYLQLQRLLHPDNFSQKSLKEQEFSEHQSALVNKAYNTLLKPLSRGLYMLELQGLRIEEGTDSTADAALLMELMEINEALDEAPTPDAVARIGKETKGKLAGLTGEIDAALRRGELQAAKELLVQMKYFANIEEKVKGKLAEFM